MVFSRVDYDVLIDSIPLCEIKSVDHLKDANGQAEKNESTQTQFQNVLPRMKSFVDRPGSCSNKNCLDATQPSIANIGLAETPSSEAEVPSRPLHASVVQIKTDPDGHNSGRTYYLRTISPCDVDKLMNDLPSLAKSAKFRADKKSRFEKNQLLVRRAFSSRPVQYLMAALIFGVVTLFIILNSHFVAHPSHHDFFLLI